MGSEKPTAGQRWRIPSGMYAGDIELTEVMGKSGFRFKWTSGDRAGRSDGADLGWLEIWKAEYLGPSPGPQPGKGRAAMGEKRDGLPLLCLNCGERDPDAGMYHCLTCMEPAAFSSRAQRRKEWRAGARDFPRPRSSQGEPRAAKVCDVCKCATWPGSRIPVHAPACPHHNTMATGRREPAPAATPKPVKREVFAGGAWLDYNVLHDPDPFDRYKRRRENGVEAAVVVEAGVRVVGCYTSDKQVEYGTEKTIAEAMSGRRRKSSSLTLTPWLATDEKPVQRHPYSTPSGSKGVGR